MRRTDCPNLRWTRRAAALVLAGWGATLVAQSAAPDPAKDSRPDTRRSGLDFMTPALQALQRDDSQNPAMLWIADGAALWQTRPTSSPTSAPAKSCQDCHGDAPRSMAGVAARYPAWDERDARPLNLAGRVNTCRSRHQGLPPGSAALPNDHPDQLALLTYIGLQSRGQPLAPPADPRLDPLRAQGQALWQQRLGQLNLACTHCHDQHAGARLAGAAIPQGHATGYPSYRLEWQSLGSLQRRLRACVVGVRAEPWAADATEWLALEAWLAQRAQGMAVETPAVRP